MQKIGKYEVNNIYNEDCYKAIKNIPDKSIDLIYIDIPYEITYSGGGCLQARFNDKLRNTLSNNNNLTKGIDYSIFDEFVRILKYIYIYIWCSKSQIYDIMNYFVNKGCNYQILVWVKDNAVPFGNLTFLSDKEVCLCFYEKGAKFNTGWEHKNTWYLSHINYADKKEYDHPTIKPLEFVKNHILNSSKEGDVVLDCFMGSGTTAVACKELGRNYIGFELNPTYWQIAVDRVNGISQKDKRIKETGQLSLFDLEENK